ncbi:hypothetical protein ACSTTN_24230, partial [Vibrio sp. WXL103]
MKLTFPITKSDGSVFTSQQEIEKLLSNSTKSKTGPFGFNPSNRCWHGGIHINDSSASWAKDTHPVQAIADGEIVAYRMTDDYLTSTYEGKTLQYSHCFCLIRHNYFDNDDQSNFEFFSLYMHLAPTRTMVERDSGRSLPPWMVSEVKGQLIKPSNLCDSPKAQEDVTLREAGQIQTTLP